MLAACIGKFTLIYCFSGCLLEFLNEARIFYAWWIFRFTFVTKIMLLEFGKALQMKHIKHIISNNFTTFFKSTKIWLRVAPVWTSYRVKFTRERCDNSIMDTTSHTSHWMSKSNFIIFNKKKYLSKWEHYIHCNKFEKALSS